jgi:O-succinylbenzoic acid--CoA ligase
MMIARELSRKAGAAAALLQAAGVRNKQVVAVISPSPVVVCVLAHATAALGVPLLPLDPALPEAAIEHLLTQTGAGTVVAQRSYSACGHIDAAAILACAAAQAAPSSHFAPDDIALMVATSGSSGQPRAVMLTAHNLRAAAQAAAAHTPLRPDDRWLACLPLFHIGGFSILVRCALAGAEALLRQDFDAERVWHALGTQRITHLSLVPTMLAQLLDLTPHTPPPSLRHVLVGGAALSGELAERAARQGWPLQPTYGMSETASQVATLARLSLPWRPGLVGRPLPGVEVKQDADGRLKVRGPMVMAGYANPAHRRGDGLVDGWFVSSDLGQFTTEGELVISGRVDAVIVSGGKKVHPAWVEEALTRCPGVNSAGVVGRADAIWGELVTVVYSGEVDAESVLSWCRDNMSGPSRPRAALRVAALPLLTNGKPDRRALRELAAGAAVAQR